MTTIAPIQFGVVAKYFSLFLIAISFLGAAISYLAVGDVILSWAIFLANVIVAAFLAWQFYKYRAHTVLAYNDSGFRLTIGRHETERKWQEFSHVSLVHMGGGTFVLRLYQDNKPGPEIPVSALKLNPQEFRFKVMEYLGHEAVINRT